MTEGQRALRKVREQLEWAERMFDESAVPISVDVDKLLRNIGEAVRLRAQEATHRMLEAAKR